MAREGFAVRAQVEQQVDACAKEEGWRMVEDEGVPCRGCEKVESVNLGWRDQAACLGRTDLDWDGDLRHSLFAMCMGCPVQVECLMEALDHEERSDAGVWGGTGPEERRRIRKGEDPYVVWREIREMMA